MTLWGVRDKTPSNLGAFLQQFNNLGKLSCWAMRPPVDKKGAKRIINNIPDKSTIDFGRDLISGEKLTRLALCYTKLTSHSPLANLTELYTDNCHWSPEIFEVFHKLFPSLKRVSFGYCDFAFNEDEDENCLPNGQPEVKKSKTTSKELLSSVSIRLMTNLRKIKNLEYIRVTVLDWEAKPFTYTEKMRVLHFLEKAGLHSPKNKPYNFELKRDMTQTVGDDVWKGILYNEKDDLEQEYVKDDEKYDDHDGVE